MQDETSDELTGAVRSSAGGEDGPCNTAVMLGLPRGFVVSSTTARFSRSDLAPHDLEPVRGAVASRVSEFAAGRWCAHRCLAALELPFAPLRPGADRVPDWPAGVAASISHSAELAIAVAGPIGRVISLGVDTEPHRPLPSDLPLDVIADAEEQHHLRRIEQWDPELSFDRILFSAKESAFKCWYTGVSAGRRRILDFHDVRVRFGPSTTRSGWLRAEVVDGRSLRGHWLVAPATLDRGPQVITVLTAPAPEIR